MQPNFRMTQAHPPELVQQIRNTAPGQAHWAGTGPAGMTCGQCQHWTYWRQIRNRVGDIVRTEQHKGCGKYEQLTDIKGPQINPPLFACRHFQARAAGSQGGDRGGERS
jgi:hypothetical protein